MGRKGEIWEEGRRSKVYQRNSKKFIYMSDSSEYGIVERLSTRLFIYGNIKPWETITTDLKLTSKI